MMRVVTLLTLAFPCLLLGEATPPNIVFILVDDLGWTTMHGTNKTCRTPHIDRLADEGMTFTCAYAYASAPICSASRASILTGKTPARLGFEFVTKWDNDERRLAYEHLRDSYPTRPPPLTYNLPLYVRWPGVIHPGRTSNEPVIGSDLLPTFAEAAGLALDSTELDGTSLLPILRGTDDRPQRDLIWHFPYYHPEKNYEGLPRFVGLNDAVAPFVEPHSAIRSGPYKLLCFYERQHTELFHIGNRFTEDRNLATQKPEVAQRLGLALRDYLTRVNARLPQGKTGKDQ
jgi:arylsulfatase A-like enzyme